MSAGRAIEVLARAEIESLHEFFVSWFTAAEESPIEFSDCERAFADDFVLVDTDGSRHDRNAVVERLEKARGRTSHEFRILILDLRMVWLRDDTILVEYVEQQSRDGKITQRRSAALLRTDRNAPRGMVWLFLQETWMKPFSP